MKQSRSVAMIAMIIGILICPAGGVQAGEITITNQPGDAFFTKVSKPDNAVTRERTKQYAEQRLSQCLKQAGLQSDIKAAFAFAIGIEGQILKDPIKDPKGSLLNVGGTAELQYPRVKADFQVTENGRDLFAVTFSGGNVNGSKDWEGVHSVIDMSIGHLLKEFAKRGRQTTQIVTMLTKEKLIPKALYVHLEVDFGKIRIHQDNNLWQALGEIGQPAAKALEEATRDKDPEVSEEAKLSLQKVKKP